MIFEIEPMLDEYYTEKEWNLKKGNPKAKKLRKTGLGYIVTDLKRNGIKIKFNTSIHLFLFQMPPYNIFQHIFTLN